MVRLALTVAVLPLVLWICFSIAVECWPSPLAINQEPANSTHITDRNGTALAALVAPDGQWRIPLAANEISPHLLHAIIAVEDARFYEHHGVDWKSVASAAWDDFTHRSIRRGASTLTMQVQRLREPKPRSLWNKLQQAVRAEQLERRLTKQQLLTEYVNRAPFGGNLMGAGAASWRYFGRPCRQLSLGQAALLAGLPQSPNRLRPDCVPERARLRRRHVLDRMLACGFIDQRERDSAASEPLSASWRPLPQDRPADGLPPADGALPALLSLARQRPGQIVRCTIDATIQRQVALATSEHLRLLQHSGVSATAVVVLDTQTAECLAAVSLDPGDSAIDLTRRPRSTGSTLKPFIYAGAFDASVCGPDSVLSDLPSAWPGYQPNDYDRAFRGRLSAAEALAESRNIPAMLVLSKLGLEPAVGLMDAAGLHALVRSPGRYGLSLAIGGAEASPIELAEAYAALGRGGTVVPARLMLDDDHARPQTISRRILRAQACWQVLTALSESDRTAGVCPEARLSHVAWKTGTSSGHRDAWSAAVTHRKTVVVWLGNAGGRGSPCLVGQEAAAPLALRLIAVLDPADAPWPAAPDLDPNTERRELPSPAPLVMVSPASGQEFVLTKDVPKDRQRVVLEARHQGQGTLPQGSLWWFVDDELIGACSDRQRLWWAPSAGAHEVRVVDKTGHSATARVRVRGFE